MRKLLPILLMLSLSSLGQRVNLGSDVKGKLPPANGGTGIDLTGQTGCLAVNSGVVSVVTCGGSTPTASAPTASPAAGTFSSTQYITFADSTPGALIYYTSDGSTPTTSSTQYTSAITVAATTTLKAIAAATGYLTSAPASFAYAISGSSSYPTSQPISVIATGENGMMNGFLPFCPTPSNCSVIYKDVSGDPVDTANNSYLQGYSNYATASLNPNFQDSTATLPWYTLDSTPGVDTAINYLSASSQNQPTETDTTVDGLKSDMVQEGGGNPNVPWTGDGRDRHLGIIDKHLHLLTDTYQAQTVNGALDVYSNTVWDLMQPIEAQNTGGYTSADAAGLPQLALGVTYEDLAAGVIKHALRVTLQHTSCGFYAGGDTYGLYTAPASHAACSGGGTRVAYMGERIRLKASTNISGLTPQALIIATALKKYGFIVADNGCTWCFQGTYDSRINQSDVANLSSLHGSDFEVVQESIVVGGELNPETLTLGTTKSNDQTGLYGSTVQGPAINNSPGQPTVTSFTASSSTVAIGSSFTLNLVATNAVKSFVDNAYGTILGNSGSITVTPTQTTTYTAKVRGLTGYAYSSPVTVTVTGTAVATPTFSPTPGTYTSSQTITISDATSGAAIHYNTSGAASCSSTLYSAPITISNPTTFSAIGCASGMINSAIANASYNISIAGATPSVLGYNTSGGYADGAAQSVTRTFAGSTTAIVSSVGSSGTVPSGVTCGGVAGTLVGTASGSGGSAFTVAVYTVAPVPSGSQTCNVTYPSSVYGLASVTEVSNTSGLDAYSTGTGTAYPNVTCGSVTTTGTNRLVIAYGQVEYSTVTASSGYTGIFSAGAFAGASLPVSTASTNAITLNTNNGSSDASCVAIALKP